jgi:hypothetical protein
MFIGFRDDDMLTPSQSRRLSRRLSQTSLKLKRPKRRVKMIRRTTMNLPYLGLRAIIPTQTIRKEYRSPLLRSSTMNLSKWLI